MKSIQSLPPEQGSQILMVGSAATENLRGGAAMALAGNSAGASSCNRDSHHVVRCPLLPCQTPTVPPRDRMGGGSRRPVGQQVVRRPDSGEGSPHNKEHTQLSKHMAAHIALAGRLRDTEQQLTKAMCRAGVTSGPTMLGKGRRAASLSQADSTRIHTHALPPSLTRAWVQITVSTACLLHASCPHIALGVVLNSVPTALWVALLPTDPAR